MTYDFFLTDPPVASKVFHQSTQVKFQVYKEHKNDEHQFISKSIKNCCRSKKKRNYKNKTQTKAFKEKHKYKGINLSL